MNILSIKGGGARGVIVTRFLVEIEVITGVSIYELFDHIGGTSVGALIGSGVLVTDDNKKPKYSAKEIHEIFIEEMKTAFSWTVGSWLKSGFGLFGPYYTSKGLLKITDKLCGDKLFGNLLRPVIFPAFDKVSNRAYYFDTEKDKDIKLRDVIMATTAAPTYFPSYDMVINGKKYDMVDGGLVINNTAELTYLRATRDMRCIDKSKILELNIGTGIFENEISDSDGLLTWMPVIVNTLMNNCNENQLYELSLSLSPDNYFIMDVDLEYKYYKIDDTSETTINYYLKKTEDYIYDNYSEIMKFCYKLMDNKGILRMECNGYESAEELNDEE